MRRVDRWLHNDRIEVHPLYGPLIQHGPAEWGQHGLDLALDPSSLWATYCVVHLSRIYRGRAIPLGWQVLQRQSSSLAYEADNAFLDKAALWLPRQCKVVFLADRGFTDTHLMDHLRKLDWPWRIRIKRSFWIYRHGHRPCKISRLSLAAGEAWFWHQVYRTEKCYGPVQLALARHQESQQDWFVVSDAPTDLKPVEEYGVRFDIEEHFFDDQADGFQLASSLIRSTEALARLCLVLAITTLYLVSQGGEVVKQGKRRWVAPHWLRGSRYLKIGWHWVILALSRGYELGTRLSLGAGAAPEPAMASKSQYQKQLRRFSALTCQDAAA